MHKESVQLIANTSMYMTRVLDHVKAERGLPKVIRTDNGPEFAGLTMHDWTGAASICT